MNEDFAQLFEKTLAVGAQHGTPRLVERPAPGFGTPYTLVPKGYEVKDLSDLIWNTYREHPHRKIVKVKVDNSASFCEYYAQFSDENSRVFADERTLSVSAVLDYHAAGSEGAPRWGDHKLALQLEKSPELLTWLAGDKKPMAQLAFAEFLEDNSPDIVEPSAAHMIDLASDLQATNEVSAASAVRLDNGQVQIKYVENLSTKVGKQQVEVPQRFKIAIPLFVGGERQEIQAMLRYRINQQAVQFHYHLLHIQQLLQAMFVSSVAGIEDELNINVIRGTIVG